ncbi:MAG: efflux RND transporter periplasmic adaptor subunit [Pseudomonadota bacterium]
MPTPATPHAMRVIPLAVALFWGLTAGAQDGGEAGGAAAPLPAVTVAEATTQALAQTARYSGRLDADGRVALVARVSGTLLEVGFEAGDVVEEGHVLYILERDLYEAAAREAEGAVRAAEAQRDLAEIERDRQQELVSRDAAPQANLDNAEAALGRAEGELIRAEAALQAAEINLSYTEITAPFAGRIGPSAVDPGALIGPETGALTTLIDLSPIHAEFQVPAALLRDYVEALAAGTASTEAAVFLELANGSLFDEPGTVDFIAAEVDAGTDSITMRAMFENADRTLLDGELVQVELRADAAAEALAVPQEAVQRDVQGAFVLVVDGESAVEARRVVVARITEGFAVIEQGLDAGERVVTEGANKVRPGQQVDAALAEGG